MPDSRRGSRLDGRAHGRLRRMRWLIAAGCVSVAAGVPIALSAGEAGATGAARTGAHHAAVAQAPASVLQRLPVTARDRLRGPDRARRSGYFDGLGVRPGTIKHVWLIILENKSYDATFTGLNNNTYLWKTLPSQGVLLKNYYGTGHFSQDNYLSLVSGQAPLSDTQNDCPDYDAITGSIDYAGTLRSDPDYGQLVSAAGPNAASGQNGCVYPASVPTLFNQFDTAGVSWKGYAQDLGNPDSVGPTHDAGTQYCGAPFAQPGPTGSTAQPNPGAANSTDQYVPKHFPFPWFESILRSGDCNSRHIANLFSTSDGLYHDLQHARTTPAFSWITPDNCSDGHDAVCAGNNLSGGFANATTPRAPTNYTGGLYAADLFLEHVIPEIERSPAYRQGGLIDITFDEAFPPFTYTANSFSNCDSPPHPDSHCDAAPNYSSSLASDAAGETLFGQGTDYEPTGPNLPLQTAADGDELYPGPGDNSYIDRPASCRQQTVPSLPAGTCLLGGGETPAQRFPQRSDPDATAAAGSTVIADSPAIADPSTSTAADTGIQADDEGRAVTGAGIPAGAFVGPVTATPATATAPSGEPGAEVYTASFELVDSGGDPIATTGAVHGITLSADTAQTDPLFTATGETNGGGDTGSVLISPDIRPGTTSSVYYNHYSWLRTMEDLFAVASSSPGLDGLGHIGYAAQPGLQPFGTDVFNGVGRTTHRHRRRHRHRGHHRHHGHHRRHQRRSS